MDFWKNRSSDLGISGIGLMSRKTTYKGRSLPNFHWAIKFFDEEIGFHQG